MTLPSTYARRGLTLIEVVAATVLLLILAATGISLIREARFSLARPADDAVVFDLRIFADAFLANPEHFGVRTDLHEMPTRDVALVWNEQPGMQRRPAQLRTAMVRLVAPAESGADHGWLVFHTGNADDRSVSRLVPIPEKQEASR